MIKQLAISLALLISLQTAMAQDEEKTFGEVLSFHPFHLVNNGIRIDYDRRIGNNHWIQIGPQFYAAERTEDNDFREYNELLGFGISIYHRIYVGDKKPSLGTYFSYGATINHFQLTYAEPTSSAINVISETQINKFGGDIIIGYQTKAFERLIVDVYAGLGARYADRNYTGATQKKFNKFMYDYGFTGNVLMGGIRIGFSF